MSIVYKLPDKTYTYYGTDITLELQQKVEDVISALAIRRNISAEEAETLFEKSDLYYRLLEPDTMLFAESTEDLLWTYFE